MKVVYRGKERLATYEGNKVAVMVVKSTGMRWVNPTQDQVDRITSKYQVVDVAGGKDACTIQLQKKFKDRMTKEGVVHQYLNAAKTYYSQDKTLPNQSKWTAWDIMQSAIYVFSQMENITIEEATRLLEQKRVGE